MIFCGQCGFQLAPGTTLCPRCGAKIEENNGPATDLHPDDATIATHSLNLQNPPGPSQISPPQPLILRPGTNSNDYGSQMAYDDATRRMEAPTYGTQMTQNPPIGPATYTSNYPQQSGSAYPAPGNYPDFTNRGGSGTYGGGGYPLDTQRGYQQPYTQDTNKVRVTALALILIGVLLLFIAVILFVLQRTNAFADITPPSNPTAIISTISTSTLGVRQQTIQQHFDAINGDMTIYVSET